MQDEEIIFDKNDELNNEWLKLMKDWKKKRPEYKPFCDDGILKYWKGTSKIVFLLKETYYDFYKIRGTTHYGQGNGSTFWRRMRMWTYIIDEHLKGNKPNFKDTYNIKEEINDSIGYVNLKKFAERDPSTNEWASDDKDLLERVINDKDYLLKQIKLLNPNIILCCGTFKYCEILFKNITKISNKFYKADGFYLIEFGHPSQRNKSYKQNFCDLNKIMSSYIKAKNIA